MDRPIIFSAPMVRALLDGRKTQTRRVLKPQPDTSKISPPFHPEPRAGRSWVFMARDDFPGYSYATADFRAPYAVGDRLWVRESGWERPERTPAMMREGADTWARFYYAADGLQRGERDDLREWGFKRRPSIHMPRWASRLTLTVTDVRVQRLQEISEADAVAEGVPVDYGEHIHGPGGFRDIWSDIHGPAAWDANPWVVALTFTVERRNIDAKES